GKRSMLDGSCWRTNGWDQRSRRLPSKESRASRGKRRATRFAASSGGLEAVDQHLATGIEIRHEIVTMDVEPWRERQPDIGSRILHDLLHAQIDLLALRRIALGQALVPEILEFRIRPAFPVPDADLVLFEPLDRIGWVGRAAILHDPQLQGLPVVALFLEAEIPEWTGVDGRDLHLNANVREVGLDDLRRHDAVLVRQSLELE